MGYVAVKGLGRGHCRKTEAERVLTFDQFKRILAACDKTADTNPRFLRDRMILYLGFMQGLRVGECVILRRACFVDLIDKGVIHVPTLKQSERVPYLCMAKVPDSENGGTKTCNRKIRVRADRIGQMAECPRCGAHGKVQKPKRDVFTGIKLVDVDIVEGPVVGAIEEYLDSIPQDQDWLFTGRDPNYHISTSQVEKIFSTYAQAAGISAKVSFHSLRHGRGTQLYSQSDGKLKAVSAGLRHSDPRSSERYAHLDQDAKDLFRKKLEASYKRKMAT